MTRANINSPFGNIAYSENGSDGVIHMIPGPVSVSAPVLASMCADLDRGHSEDDHMTLYQETTQKLARLMGTANDVVLMYGEGMLVLWGALKSALKAGDKLLCIDTGLFGAGFADMGAALGCECQTVSITADQTINQGDTLERIEEAVRLFKPKMITLVHCETPSGTLNPVEPVGEIKKRLNVPLLCVDAVSSMGGAEVKADEWGVDILMGGSQKCISAPPSTCFASVSPEAWELMAEVGYAGYDAFLPFRKLEGINPFPYTPYRQGTAALNTALELIFNCSYKGFTGLEASYALHEETAAAYRAGFRRLGLEMFPEDEAIMSPTVSTIRIPNGHNWKSWNAALRKQGLVAGNNFGELADLVFRIGHMGTQADPTLVPLVLNCIEKALKD